MSQSLNLCIYISKVILSKARVTACLRKDDTLGASNSWQLLPNTRNDVRVRAMEKPTALRIQETHKNLSQCFLFFHSVISFQLKKTGCRLAVELKFDSN